VAGGAVSTPTPPVSTSSPSAKIVLAELMPLPAENAVLNADDAKRLVAQHLAAFIAKTPKQEINGNHGVTAFKNANKRLGELMYKHSMKPKKLCEDCPSYLRWVVGGRIGLPASPVDVIDNTDKGNVDKTDVIEQENKGESSSEGDSDSSDSDSESESESDDDDDDEEEKPKTAAVAGGAVSTPTPPVSTSSPSAKIVLAELMPLPAENAVLNADDAKRLVAQHLAAFIAKTPKQEINGNHGVTAFKNANKRLGELMYKHSMKPKKLCEDCPSYLRWVVGGRIGLPEAMSAGHGNIESNSGDPVTTDVSEDSVAPTPISKGDNDLESVVVKDKDTNDEGKSDEEKGCVDEESDSKDEEVQSGTEVHDTSEGSIEGDSDTEKEDEDEKEVEIVPTPVDTLETGDIDEGDGNSDSESDTEDEEGDEEKVETIAPPATIVQPGTIDESDTESESESESEISDTEAGSSDEDEGRKTSESVRVADTAPVLPVAKPKSELEQYMAAASDSDSDDSSGDDESAVGGINKRRVSFTSTPAGDRQKKLRLGVGSPLDSLLFKPLPLKSPSHLMKVPGKGSVIPASDQRRGLSDTDETVQLGKNDASEVTESPTFDQKKKQKVDVSTREVVGVIPDSATTFIASGDTEIDPLSSPLSSQSSEPVVAFVTDLAPDKRMCERCGRVLNKKTKHPRSACNTYMKKMAADKVTVDAVR